jgi:MFS family permease
MTELPNASIDADQEALEKPYPRAWFTTGVLAFLAAISILDRNIVTLFVDPIKHDMGLSDTQMSLLIGAAFAVPFGVLGIPAGWAVDRYSRRTVIALGLATWSIATMAAGVVKSFSGLVIARSLVGAGDAALGPANSSLLSDLFPRNKLALPMAVTGMGNKIGQGSALIIGGSLALLIDPSGQIPVPGLGERAGWQVIFLLVGIPGLLILPLVFLISEPRRHASPGKSADFSFGAFASFWLKNWRFLLPHHTGFLLLVAMSNAVMAWAPAFLVREHDWPASAAGAWLGTALLAAPMLGMPLHGWLADRFHRGGRLDIYLRYPMITAALSAPLGIYAFLAPSPEATVISIGLFLFIVSGYASLPLTALMTVVPGHLRGKATAVVGLVCGAGGVMLGPLMVGSINDAFVRDPDRIGLSIMAVMAILLPLIILCLALALPSLRRMRSVLS